MPRMYAAPKDGTKIILYPASGDPFIGYWVSTQWRHRKALWFHHEKYPDVGGWKGHPDGLHRDTDLLAWQPIPKAEDTPIPLDFLDTLLVEELEVQPRTKTVLIKNGFKTAGDVVRKGRYHVMHEPGVGRKTMNDFTYAMPAGFSWDDYFPEDGIEKWIGLR